MDQPTSFDTGKQPSGEDGISSRIYRTKESIRKLERRAHVGVYLLAAFILLSIGATHNFSFLPALPPAIRNSMGVAPPAGLISVALIVYVFSAVIISLARMMEGVEKIGGVSHLGYLGAFFFFYHFSGDMDAHFWAVFAGGATILTLESYQRWNFCRDEIQKEKELLLELEEIARQKGAPVRAE